MRDSPRTATILVLAVFAAACSDDTAQGAARRKAIELVAPGTNP